MCNDFGNNVPYSAYLEAFRETRLPVVFPTAVPNLEPRDDIWPTEPAPIFRRREEGVEMVQLRWASRRRGPRGHPSLTSALRDDGSRKDAHTSSSSPARNRLSRNGSSPRPGRIGSALP